MDDMLDFFENAKNNAPVATSVKEDLIMRAAQVENQPFKQFEQAADEEIRFNRVCALLKDELEKLELHLENTDDVEYSPEVDRYMRWVQTVRSEMAQIPRTHLTDDLKKVLDQKRVDATRTQLMLMSLKPVGASGGIQKQERRMAEWHIVVQEFLRENQNVRQVLFDNWIKTSDSKEFPEEERKKLLLSNPPTWVGDIELLSVNGQQVFTNQKWNDPSGQTPNAFSSYTNSRKAYNQKVDVQYVKEILRNSKLEIQNLINLFGSVPTYLEKIKLESEPELNKMSVRNALQKSHRHALEDVSTAITRAHVDGKIELFTCFKDEGETAHLRVLLDRFIDEEETTKALDGKKADKMEKRAIFEVEVLRSLLAKVEKTAPEEEREAAKAAINSSIEAFMLYTQYAGTPPDQDKAFKDPASLLKVQGLNTSYVKSLSDKEGYRVVFPQLDMKEEPDVHTLGHQTLNPFLLDKMHRSEEFKTALLRAAENYIAHTAGRATVLAMIKAKESEKKGKGIKLTRG